MPSCFFLFLFIYHTGKTIPSLIPDFNGVCSIIILTILADSFDCIFSWIVRFSFQFIFSFSSQMNFLFRRKFFSFLILPRDFLSDSTHTPPFSYLERLHKKDRRNVYRVTSFEGKDLKKWTKFWKKKDKKKTKIKARSSPTTPLFNSNLFWEKNQGKNFVFSARAKKLLMSFMYGRYEWLQHKKGENKPVCKKKEKFQIHLAIEVNYFIFWNLHTHTHTRT